MFYSFIYLFALKGKWGAKVTTLLIPLTRNSFFFVNFPKPIMPFSEPLSCAYSSSHILYMLKLLTD